MRGYQGCIAWFLLLTFSCFELCPPCDGPSWLLVANLRVAAAGELVTFPAGVWRLPLVRTDELTL